MKENCFLCVIRGENRNHLWGGSQILEMRVVGGFLKREEIISIGDGS